MAYPSRTLCIPDNGYTNLYGVFYDLDSGDMFHATTGAVSATWTACAIAAARHANNNAVWLIATPPVEENINLGLNLFENASPADADLIQKATKYSPRFNLTYNDSTPAAQGKTLTR